MPTTIDKSNQDRDERPSPSSVRSRLMRVLTYPPAAAGGGVVAVMVGMALFAGVLAPYDPGAEAGPARRPPSWMSETPDLSHPLGTNGLGQDLFSRMLYGARRSLGFGLLSVGVALVIGVPLGLLAGYAGGRTDFFIMRVIDLMMSFPGILLAILLMAILGQNRQTLVGAVGLINVPTLTRQTRASVMAAKNEAYVTASRALGCGHLRIMFGRVLPNVAGPIIVLATLGLGRAVLETAGLGFLGLGLPTDAVEWGTMLAQSRIYVLRSPWIPIVPGVALSLSVLGFNLLGDGIRDLLDPRRETGVGIR